MRAVQHILAATMLLAGMILVAGLRADESLGVAPAGGGNAEAAVPPPVSAVTSSAGMAPGSEAAGDLFGDASTGDRTYAVAEALFLSLGRPHTQPLVIDDFSANTLLTTAGLNFDMQPGERFTLGRKLNDWWTIEGTYFGVQNWSTSNTVTGTFIGVPDNYFFPNTTLGGSNALITPINGGGPLSPADWLLDNRIVVSEWASFQNAELNMVRSVGDTDFSVVAGFRYIGLYEGLDVNAGHDAGTLGPGSPADRSDYLVQAQNNLIGAQVGGQWRKQVGRWGFEVAGKAGIFGNVAQQHTFLGDYNNTVVYQDGVYQQSRLATLVELDCTGLLQVTDHLYLRAGYNFMYIEGVARAADQLDWAANNAGRAFAVSFGTAFLQGFSTGIEARW